jgi:hypothetical protein
MEVESDVSDDVVGCFWNALNWASGVTERPSVAQNPAQVTTSPRHKNPPKNISSSLDPLFQALSSRFRIFLECSSNKLAA